MDSSAQNKPARFCNSWLIRIGVALFVLGSGPLLFIMLAAKLGWTGDPNPNPVGFGILAGVTLWPSIVLIIAGIISILAAKKNQSDSRN